MRNNYLYSIGLLLISAFLFYGYVNEDTVVKEIKYHPEEFFNTELPNGFNTLFAGSGECAFCHDDLTSTSGEDVGIASDWRSTMMANSAKDPFWRAKVSHEIIAVPGNKEIVETTCTRCHAPAGNIEAHNNGQTHYSIEEMENDPLALDGVTCTVCHQITQESMGNISGKFQIGEDRLIWGPYSFELFAMPMQQHTDYTPIYGGQMHDSRLCGSCHTLITNTVDLDGNFTGGTFVEQAIFHEWQNSDYSSNGTSCQTCHIPQTDDGVVISTRPPWFDVERSPFGKHELVGANVFMLNILKDNAEELGVTATSEQFDNTISRTLAMLQEKTLEVNLTQPERTEDTLFLELNLINKAGHKFPGGYPSRRAFVSLMVINEFNDTIFHSGQMDENFELVNEDSGFEPHYNVINKEDEVQIYEMVMGNVNGDITTILEHADTHLKDNRLPPTGFTTEHFTYDTVQIVGNAFTDTNFNKNGTIQGTGGDKLHFHIPIDGETGDLAIIARVYYQTVSAKWLSEMFSHSSDEIDAFKSFYEAADKTPTMVSEAFLASSLNSINSPELKGSIKVFPNPAKDNLIVESSDLKILNVDIFTLAGQKVTTTPSQSISTSKTQVYLPKSSGLYLLKILLDGEETVVHKVAIVE
jgi:hypothetical protein